MKTSITQTLRWASVAALAAFAFTGCMTQSVKDPSPADGGNGLINQETSSMGQIYASSALSKAGASDTGELIIKTRTLDTTCLPGPCFVRDAQFTTPNGKFDRERRDTVWLLDSHGAYMTVFAPRQATQIRHNRHVTRINNSTGNQIDIQFNTVLTWAVDGTDTVGVWSGTITGTLNGVEFKNATISGVKRLFTPGAGFGPPMDGDIKCQRGDFSIDIHFQGGGRAGVDVRDNRNGKEHHLDMVGELEVQKC